MVKIRFRKAFRAFERGLRFARVSTRVPNQPVGVGRPDDADPNRPGHEVLVASERLDIGLAAGWPGLGVREVQGEVAADDRKVVHGDSVNHQNAF